MLLLFLIFSLLSIMSLSSVWYEKLVIKLLTPYSKSNCSKFEYSRSLSYEKKYLILNYH